MKICIVSPYDYLHPGGVSEHVRHLAHELGHRGHTVVVMAPSSKVGDNHGIPGYVRIGRSVPIRSNGSVARIALSFHLVKRIRTLLEVEDFDVVHYHEPLVPALPITVLRFHRGVNVGTFHAVSKRNIGYYYGRPFLKRYFNRLHACIAVSEPARTFVRTYFNGDIEVVPNGIDCSRFTPDLEPISAIHARGKKTILFVGRLEKRKGVGTLLAAFRELRAKRSDVQLVIVGEGPLRESLEQEIDSERIADVMFCGRVTPEDLPRYYASAQVFCSPATGGESFGIVLLEAMATGIPVVASAIPGFSHVITAGYDGILVPAKRPAMWAKTLDQLLDNHEMRRLLGEGGMTTAKRFDWSRVVDDVLAVYSTAQERALHNKVAANVY
ncbi:MAG: glycosyltransferase family 4 protein [Candidatus Dormibacteria bacterium]